MFGAMELDGSIVWLSMKIKFSCDSGLGMVC